MSHEFDVVQTVLAAASSYNLTDLPTTKAELNIGDTSLDSILTTYLGQCTQAIMNYCNRTFQVETLQDQIYLRRPHHAREIQLTRWPLANYAYVSLTGNTHGTTTVDGLSKTAGLAAGQPVFGAGIPAGDTILSVNTGASSLVLTPTAATASASGVALTTGVSIVETDLDGTQTTLVQGVDFVLRPLYGQVIRLDSSNNSFPTRWRTGAITVQYSAGYTTIPADVVDACLRLITGRLKARGRDPMLRTEGEPGLGQVQYWVGTAPGQRGSLPPEVASLLDSYRVPQVR